MKRLVLLILALLALAIPASAQTTGTTSSKLILDEAAPDLATAQSYSYAYYPDVATTPTPIVLVCAGTSSPFTCSGNFPAFTPGGHTLSVTARNVAGESIHSAPLSFTFVVVPNAPQNLRIGGDDADDADYVLWGVERIEGDDAPHL